MKIARVLIAIFTFCFVFGYACLLIKETREQPTWRLHDGKRTRWAELPVRWSFMCGTEIIPEFRDGFDWWNKRYGNVFVEVPQEESCLCSDRDGGCPQVYVLDGLEDDALVDAGIRRYAATYVVLDGGMIVHAAIRYYEEPFGEANEPSQRSIARHEVGHVLGLMHSGYDECLMYSTMEHNREEPKMICPGEDRLFRETYGR